MAICSKWIGLRGYYPPKMRKRKTVENKAGYFTFFSCFLCNSSLKVLNPTPKTQI